MPISPNHLEQAIRESWSAETSASPSEWDAGTAPERGQCVPTSLVVQDRLGGQLERLATDYNSVRETHYRNLLPDGTVLDLTRNQYPEDQAFEAAPVDGDTREYVLSNESTRRRYTELSRRVELALLLEP